MAGPLMKLDKPYLLRHRGVPQASSIEGYKALGGFQAVEKALKQMTPEQVHGEVTDSGVTGRGGAGFPCGRKWSFVNKKAGKPIYLVCNADESEPGTFHDRVLMENDPFQLLEGIIISSYALSAHQAYLYIRGEYPKVYKVLKQSVQAAYQAGYLGKNILGSGFDLDLIVHRGAGAYICGEETGLIESLEGKRGWPRIKPPFYPAVIGAFGCPTVVNNVQTLCLVTHIIERGAAWFKSVGTLEDPGPRCYSISGHVARPGVYEAPTGVTVRELIDEYAGGIRNGKKLKAVIPGGSSSALLKADEIDAPMSGPHLRKFKPGVMLGSAAMIVMDEDTDMVNAAVNVAHFYAHESCGQCTPCREGTTWALKILQRINDGGGREEDLNLLKGIMNNMEGQTVCLFSEGAIQPLRSFITDFREEFDAKIRQATAGAVA